MSTPQTAQALFEQGLALHRRGQLNEAAGGYGAALSVDPAHFNSLHMLGVLFVQAGQLDQGVAFISQAIQINPAVAAAHGNLANALNRLGRHEEALASAERALALQGDLADGHGNRALALHHLSRTAEAAEAYGRLAALRPADPQPPYKQAILLRGLGQPEAALAALDRALALKDDFADAHNERGGVLLALERPVEALVSFGRATALRPDHAEAHCNRGVALAALERYEDALDAYAHAIALKPDYAEAYSNRTGALRALRRLDEALESCERAISLRPDYAEAHNNRTGVLYDLRRLDDAIVACDQALALKPDLADAHNNRAVMLLEARRMDEALAGFKQAVALQPDYAEAHYNLAMCQLALGDEAAGWAEYEWRWRTHQFDRQRRHEEAPLWLGHEPLDGRTILLHVEQGLGDAIQFCRYAPRVADLGAAVIVEAPPGLERLFSTLPGVSQVIVRGAEAPAFDFQTPLMSLPLALGVPAHDGRMSYLSADTALAAHWRSRLAADGRLRVGLCWAGGVRPDQLVANAIDQRRSLSLGAFAGFADVPGVRFYSLQKGPPAVQLAELQERGWSGPEIVDVTGELNDFADTAALVANLDLVIACDTSTTHLAGALGKPVWVLNRFDACWRWGRNREDSPWYPSARLFNQPSQGDWGSVMGRVIVELRVLAGAERKLG